MKYIRTFHLPYSEGISNDDKVLKDISCFYGKDVIYTEKMDGECTSLLRDKVHARSEDSKDHPSRSWIKMVHAQISYKIPPNLQIVGENVYAKHSIEYDKLSTYFYVFAIIDIQSRMFLSVKQTIEIVKSLGLEYVPILFEGKFDKDFKIPGKSAFGSEIEGYVVRVKDEFLVEESYKNMGKWVRKNHVKTNAHWAEKWTKNQLIRGI